MKKYIKNSKKFKPRESKMAHVFVVEKDPLPSHISLSSVLNTIKKSIPSFMYGNVDSIYIGEFESLQKRSLNAMYSQGAIYVTNDQSNVEDMVEDVIHEIAHAIEEEKRSEIYSDGKIESEFRGKRQRLYFLMKSEGFEVELGDFLNLEYSQLFDDFLYKEVGYPMLSTLTVNMFYSPYGVTSLNEYFANCFEAVFAHKDVAYIKKISPKVFDKIQNLSYNEEKL